MAAQSGFQSQPTIYLCCGVMDGVCCWNDSRGKAALFIFFVHLFLESK